MDFAFLPLGVGALLALILYARVLARLWVRHVRTDPRAWRLGGARHLSRPDVARTRAIL